MSKVPRLCRKFRSRTLLQKNLMLTTRLSKNTNQSIMLTTGFSEKCSGTFFYNIFFWTFIKCPFLKKIILSFKTPFLHFSPNWAHYNFFGNCSYYLRIIGIQMYLFVKCIYFSSSSPGFSHTLCFGFIFFS